MMIAVRLGLNVPLYGKRFPRLVGFLPFIEAVL
jgi:hypothetical protein